MEKRSVLVIFGRVDYVTIHFDKALMREFFLMYTYLFPKEVIFVDPKHNCSFIWQYSFKYNAA